MDPEHAACYAQAQAELRELFHEFECNGQVSAAELQRSLVPFTAGDVKRDLLELLAELKLKRQSLDESEFLRVMWRKMYLSSAVDATKSSVCGTSSLLLLTVRLLRLVLDANYTTAKAQNRKMWRLR
ncbi:hypothetical protein BBO99_00005331 [Phytophthora kernoviae]|uniref:EF-hand domain-containing protein n=2 Tax=Phytophthora kernoviae TaxID=325452 RepID=A0A3R7K601_9STRA|nr:hypothetical protein G195_009341 [Phytophthora kernoviae 00238/432]KAG2522835.1 hypothetical protein JM16_003264 [Phytophthora kernoviae]KAG2524452.1 hypothetical protein JM18_002967 [Phytophthora kernoviae]RLN21630.1 hypothetical protein BBI17_003599 [Phytophthora kernoviae]RLN79335.1 hypothetical protein BBO99_00005331 [Phytophthora kernoviae]